MINSQSQRPNWFQVAFIQDITRVWYYHAMLASLQNLGIATHPYTTESAARSATAIKSCRGLYCSGKAEWNFEGEGRAIKYCILHAFRRSFAKCVLKRSCFNVIFGKSLGGGTIASQPSGSAVPVAGGYLWILKLRGS